MLDKRDAFVAQLAKELGILNDAMLPRVVELRKRVPGRPLEQLLEEAGLLSKDNKRRLSHEFNARVRAMQAGGAAPKSPAPSAPGAPAKPLSTRTPQPHPAPPARPAVAPPSTRAASTRAPAPQQASGRATPPAPRGVDESGVIRPDAQDRSLLAGRPSLDPLATPPSDEDLTDSSDVSVNEDELLAEPTIMLPDEELKRGPAKAPPKKPEPKLAPVSDEDEILSEPTIMLPDEELRKTPKAPPKKPEPKLAPVSDEDEILSEPTMMLPDEELRKTPASKRVPAREPELEPPSDEDELLSEPTLMVPDEELKRVPGAKAAHDGANDEEKILAEPTIVVPDEELGRKPRAKSESKMTEDEILAEPTLVVPDEPLSLKDDSSEKKVDVAIPDELRIGSGSGAMAALPSEEKSGPQPGVKSKRGGKLDRKEFDRRQKLRMNFEGLRLGDYEIVGELSRGAFGVVLKVKPEGQAKQLAKEREFAGEFMAMKVMLETNDPEETKRFMDEVKVLIGLVHPNIVRIFDAGVEGGLKYYTMEMIVGVDSRTLVRESGGKLPVLYAARIAKDVAGALASVHAKTIYHRDLKPANVMIDRASQPYRTVLIDFGLVVDKNEKDSGLVMGTPSYMPPEQAKPRGGFGEVNATSDVYSLGATFYFLMTGQAPFPGKDPREIIKRVVSEPPPLPSALNPEIPKNFEAIAMKCLAKAQRERFTAAWQLEKELEKELASAQLKLKAKGFMRKIFGGGGPAPPAKGT